MDRRSIMTRGLGIVGAAFVVALALSPKIAEAQQIRACVSNSDGTIRIVAQNTTCRNNEHLLALQAALGASQFSCILPPSYFVNDGDSLSGSLGYGAGVAFGSGITYTANGDNFLLQPGIYLVQLNADIAVSVPVNVTSFRIFTNVKVNAKTVDSFQADALTVNGAAFFPLTGNALLQITAANTTVGFNAQIQGSATTGVVFGCRIVFTRLQ
jgi:hypothetical protein